MCDNFVIENPKRRPSIAAGRDEWFPYYAGFSEAFARNLIQSSGIDKGSTFLDPWNGSGTSTTAAAVSGHRAIGFDLNPVMAIVAKARLLPNMEVPSVAPLLSEILKKAADNGSFPDEDPLLTWFLPSSAAGIRSIDRAIYVLLVSASQTGNSVEAVPTMSSIASFFYVALFRSVRQLLGRFRASNPTWITRPASPRSRIRPSAAEIRSTFESQVSAMSASVKDEWCNLRRANLECTIDVASSENLPVPTNSVDLVLSSPPYCTRIDYGVATSPELATLGFRMDDQLRELRAKLIGTPTVRASSQQPERNWGTTCNTFLNQVAQHPSKAAKSYYHKTYVQYFAAIARSMAEIARCIRSGGKAVIVVQDSYFKGIRADLATMFTEIAAESKLTISRQVDFPTSCTLAYINTKSRSYRPSSTLVESVLCYMKN